MSRDTELTEDELIQLKLLRDFETDALIDAGLLGKDEILSSPLDRELAFIHDELVLRISTGPSYPAGPVLWQVENHTLSRTAVIELRARLEGISETAKSVNNVHEWSKAQEDMSAGFEPIMEVLQLADETTKYVRQFREKQKSLTHASTPRTMRQIVPITTSSSVAQDLLGKTSEEICVGIQGCYRILHIEEVWRRDLTRAYQLKRERMRLLLLEKPLSSLRRYVPRGLKYSRRKEDLVDHLLRPRVTFHGTQRQYVPSIVRHGFLKPGAKDPGTGEAHRARCGSTYGAGIYSSPDSDFALSYSDSYLRSKRRPTRPGEYAGLKLVVCAVTMGRSAKVWREDGLRTQTNSLAGADSHVANHGLEYIVFDSAQIIPVLVIHIDWSEEHHVANFANLPNDPSQFVSSGKKMHPKLLSNEGLFPGDIQRQKAAVQARAAKYLPYGYGPATGGKFVVEEVGEVDEDEEDYGDFQAFRADELAQKVEEDLTFWSWVKAAEEDGLAEEYAPEGAVGQYTDERVAGNWRASAPRAWNEIPLPQELQESTVGTIAAKDDNEESFGIDRLVVSDV